MPFELTNASADFQRFINDALHPFLDHFCTVYIDDVLVYSSNLMKHKQHVRQVLEALGASGLHLKPEKYEFHKQQITYLGFIVSNKEIVMNPTKVECIVQWESCINLHDVRAFLGFSNFYRRFIKNYSKLVAPLVNLTRKDVMFEWFKKCEQAFQQLKTAFISAPILAKFDPDVSVLVEADASDYVSAGVLSQRDSNNVLHPMTFFFKKHSSAECNYEIYDKELLTIVRCFEE